MAEMIDNAVKTQIAATAEPEPVQDDLWHVVETGNADGPSPLRAAMLPPLKRARGRPAGSVNKRTLATAEWLLTQHQHPLKVQMDIISLTVDELAAQIGFKPDEVTSTLRLQLFDRQEAMRQFVVKYVAAPMPTSAEAPAGHNGVAIAIDFGGSNGVSVPSHVGAAGGAGVEVEAIFKRLSDKAQSEIK